MAEFASAPSQEGHTGELFSRDGDGLISLVFPLIPFICGWSTSWEGRSLSWPISCILSFLRHTGKGESQTVQRLRREVSVIRNLGYNYKLARRKKHGGGLSLWSTTPNEFSLFLMEKSHICKIKSQCLFDERICWLCHPLFQYHVLGKVSEKVQPLVKGVRAEQAAGFYPCFKALWDFLRKTTPPPPGCAPCVVAGSSLAFFTHQHRKLSQRGSRFTCSNILALSSPNPCVTGMSCFIPVFGGHVGSWVCFRWQEVQGREPAEGTGLEASICPVVEHLLKNTSNWIGHQGISAS